MASVLVVEDEQGIADAVVSRLRAEGFEARSVGDVADPEAFVVRHNVDRAERGAQLDPLYLVVLSDDAVPALADAIAATHDPAVRAALLAAVACDDDHADGIAGLNLAVARGRGARSEVCP